MPRPYTFIAGNGPNLPSTLILNYYGPELIVPISLGQNLSLLHFMSTFNFIPASTTENPWTAAVGKITLQYNNYSYICNIGVVVGKDLTTYQNGYPVKVHPHYIFNLQGDVAVANNDNNPTTSAEFNSSNCQSSSAAPNYNFSVKEVTPNNVKTWDNTFAFSAEPASASITP
jgi:hypothetical protein